MVVANVGTCLSVSESTPVSKSEGNDLPGALFLCEGSSRWISFLMGPHT